MHPFALKTQIARVYTVTGTLLNTSLPLALALQNRFWYVVLRFPLPLFVVDASSLHTITCHSSMHFDKCINFLKNWLIKGRRTLKWVILIYLRGGKVCPKDISVAVAVTMVGNACVCQPFALPTLMHI